MFPQRLLTCALQNGMSLEEVERLLKDASRSDTVAQRLNIADDAVPLQPTFNAALPAQHNGNNGNGAATEEAYPPAPEAPVLNLEQVRQTPHRKLQVLAAGASCCGGG